MANYASNYANAPTAQQQALRILLYNPNPIKPEGWKPVPVDGQMIDVYMKHRLEGMEELVKREGFAGSICIKRTRGKEVSLSDFPRPIHMIMEEEINLAHRTSVTSTIIGTFTVERFAILVRRIREHENSQETQSAAMRKNKPASDRQDIDWDKLREPMLTEIEANSEKMGLEGACETFIRNHKLDCAVSTLKVKYRAFKREAKGETGTEDGDSRVGMKYIKWTPEQDAELRAYIDIAARKGIALSDAIELFVDEKGWDPKKAGAVTQRYKMVDEMERASKSCF